MQTLAIVGKDLMLGTGGYNLVTGTPKITQDLRCALAENFGNDRFHPQWGSLLGSYVGRPITAELSMYVQAEANRVVQNYMAVQADQISQDVLNGVPSRFSTSEVINKIDSVNAAINIDQIDVTITFTTLANQTLSVTTGVAL